MWRFNKLDRSEGRKDNCHDFSLRKDILTLLGLNHMLNFLHIAQIVKCKTDTLCRDTFLHIYESYWTVDERDRLWTCIVLRDA